MITSSCYVGSLKGTPADLVNGNVCFEVGGEQRSSHLLADKSKGVSLLIMIYPRLLSPV